MASQQFRTDPDKFMTDLHLEVRRRMETGNERQGQAYHNVASGMLAGTGLCDWFREINDTDLDPFHSRGDKDVDEQILASFLEALEDKLTAR